MKKIVSMLMALFAVCASFALCKCETSNTAGWRQMKPFYAEGKIS